MAGCDPVDRAARGRPDRPVADRREDLATEYRWPRINATFGEDADLTSGREQVYPGGAMDYHLRPFRAALAAGAAEVMPYYGMPVGTDWEEVGFGFNKSVITSVLREQLGFDGVVCTDWGLITDEPALGDLGTARAWGVERLSRQERMRKVLDAGVDQFGGEHCTDVLSSWPRASARSGMR